MPAPRNDRRANEIESLIRQALRENGILPTGKLVEELRTIFIDTAVEMTTEQTMQRVDEFMTRMGYAPRRVA